MIGNMSIVTKLVISFTLVIAIFIFGIIQSNYITDYVNRLHRHNLNYVVARTEYIMDIELEFMTFRQLFGASIMNPAWRATVSEHTILEYEARLTSHHNRIIQLTGFYIQSLIDDYRLPGYSRDLRTALMNDALSKINAIYIGLVEHFFLAGNQSFDDANITSYTDDIEILLQNLRLLSLDERGRILAQINEIIANNTVLSTFTIIILFILSAGIAFMMVKSFKYNIKMIEDERKLNIAEERLVQETAENLRQFEQGILPTNQNLDFTPEPMPYGSALVVDDVETNLYVAKGLLNFYDLTIETATSGNQAIDKIKGGAVYDIIFMDHMMPEMNGIEATKIIRHLDYTNPIVALTANALIGQAEEFIKNGFDGFISKPIGLRELNAVLNKFIHNKHPEEAKKYAGAAAPTEHNSKLFEVFCRDAEKAVSTIRETAARGDIKLFTTTAHAMRSALLNIGEIEKAELAGALENAGIKGDTGFISANTESFAGVLETLIQSLKPIETVNEEDISEDTAFIKEQLLVIKAACEDYNEKAAYAAFDRLKEKQWKPETCTALEKTRDILFLQSDFEGAAKQVQALLRGVK